MITRKDLQELAGILGDDGVVAVGNPATGEWERVRPMPDRIMANLLQRDIDNLKWRTEVIDHRDAKEAVQRAVRELETARRHLLGKRTYMVEP